ncbi:hypothetical protein NNJEOMEG_01518 [Fundidesulfovibrio magnetotacticus]|uniref:Lipoprotein n=1 Tax=Fundidesulfovibrio magnetotacticus TaxID=2730080 RepID=A0A6V8LPN1_9BACT|nr:hypothetical protein [Fundidesulfovibrio magnetotacticus]GFK93684.1 hypothetical protein NNJEOMEG_01518 [Fundidesulfovibrio magnetotacticus]
MRPDTALRAALLAAALLALAACADQEPKTEWKFGESVQSTMQSQVANPGAGGDKPVTGMDGQAAAMAANRHEKMGEEKQGEGVFEKILKNIAPGQGQSGSK